MDSFLRHLREAQDQRFQDELDDAAPTVHKHTESMEDTRGVLTIDLDLPPVDAAPKPKGPRWRLQEIRESWERLKGRAP